MYHWLRRALRRLRGQPLPAPRLPRGRAGEAAEVRGWAMRMQRSDPRFADELYAAADRHERDDQPA